MQALTSRFGGLSAVALTFVALAAIIGWETGWGQRVLPEVETPAVPPPQPVPLSLLPDYQIEGGIASRRETVDRPAFVPTRRPAPAATQEVAKPRMARNQFTLTGTAVVDQKQIAFLRENAGGKARTVRAGESINGVVVAEVKPDRVKLVMGDESEELTLKVAAGPRQTVQPPVPGQPPQPGQPPAGARPAQTAGQRIAPDTNLPMDSDASILERRRAARAALQAQQEAAARAGGGQPAPAAPPAPGALAAPQPSNAPAAGNWGDVYRRMQQPRQ